MKTTLDGNWAIEAGNAYGQCIKVKAKLFEKQTRFQKIEIFETCEMGRLLMLDGIIQLTSFDEFAYQEMMAHLPYYAHGNPERTASSASMFSDWQSLSRLQALALNISTSGRLIFSSS